MHKNLKIIYSLIGHPYGIRDENGCLVFFSPVQKYSNQEERYLEEVQARLDLANFLLSVLKNRRRNHADPE